MNKPFSITAITILIMAVLFQTGCERKPPDGGSDTILMDSLGRPDSKVTVAKIHLYDKGTKTTEIRADQIRKFEKLDSTMAYSVDIDFFDSLGHVQTTLVGDSGVIRESTNRFHIFGNVVVSVGDTTKLETEHLIWNPETKQIETDAFVKITRRQDVITGIGMHADRELTHIKILDQVSGTIEDINQMSDSTIK
ncbi:MAG: LPS export ABC transporter periplasmic protein LptC [candidate division Zixibacteria bacterium]|nr:LPS export ABC transporter periplasmic protein LptC [candidate division Zixibacteria bacterium]